MYTKGRHDNDSAGDTPIQKCYSDIGTVFLQPGKHIKQHVRLGLLDTQQLSQRHNGTDTGPMTQAVKPLVLAATL